MPFLEVNFSISTNSAMGVGPFWGQGEPKESHKEGGGVAQVVCVLFWGESSINQVVCVTPQVCRTETTDE